MMMSMAVKEICRWLHGACMRMYVLENAVKRAVACRLAFFAPSQFEPFFFFFRSLPLLFFPFGALLRFMGFVCCWH